MNYIPGNLEGIVKQVTEKYLVVLVTGPRQVGKTTMLQKLMDGVQESLAGRAAVLAMTSLAQAEICGSSMTPFE